MPEAAISPADVGLSNPASCNLGRASSASKTTEAPTIPDEAASNTPITRTEMPMPAALPPKARCAARKERSATPDISKISPMKMNIGIATSSQFDNTLA